MIIDEIFKGSLAGIFAGVKDVVGAFKADPLELVKLESALKTAELQVQLSLVQAQTKINEIEATSTDKFVSRWRPACGWAGFAALVYAALVHPFATWASVNFGIMPPPDVNPTVLMDIVAGMLGLAGMRTYEKTTQNGKT